MSDQAQELDSIDVDPAPVEAVADEQEAQTPSETNDAAREEQIEQPEEPKMVPLAALHEERQRNKDYRAENERLSQRMDQMLARFEQIQQAPQPAPVEEVKAPSPDEDAFGYLDHQIQQIAKRQEDIAKGFEGQQQQTRQQQQYNQLAQFAAAGIEQFQQEKPDYYDAVGHWAQKRSQQLQISGLSPTQIQQALNNEQTQIVAMAAQNRRNPAQLMYEYAETFGYAPKAADAEDPAPAKLPKQPPKSVSAMAGKPATKAPKAKDIANMSQSEFEAFMASKSASERRQALNS